MKSNFSGAMIWFNTADLSAVVEDETNKGAGGAGNASAEYVSYWTSEAAENT